MVARALGSAWMGADIMVDVAAGGAAAAAVVSAGFLLFNMFR
jgi:hypothetical protein